MTTWRQSGKTPHRASSALVKIASRDADRLIVFRGAHNFVILNLFPYTSGHFMVAPFAHTARFEEAQS